MNERKESYIKNVLLNFVEENITFEGDSEFILEKKLELTCGLFDLYRHFDSYPQKIVD